MNHFEWKVHNDDRLMKKVVMWSTILFIILILIGTFSLVAQEVPHHDNLVDMSDPYTCLTCHDGTVAPNISPCTKASCILDPTASHPIFKRYPPEDKRDEFHPADEVKAAGINLDNDLVTCISCHNLANQDDCHLVMENRRSILCRTCHKRDGTGNN